MPKTVINAAEQHEERGFGVPHLVQSAIAGCYIFFVFFIMNTIQNDLAVASIGASTFIAFSSPHSKSSRPRILIGGYFCGVIAGVLCGNLITLLNNRLTITTQFTIPAYIPACAIAIVIAMLLMTALNFEHPPSAALAIAITMDSKPAVACAASLGCIIILCVVKESIRKYLRTL